MVVSDLHIGFEEKYEELGLRAKSSTESMARMLIKILDEQKPKHLIVLGDVKDSIDRITAAEWREVPPFLENLAKRARVSIIAGNHDGELIPLLPKDVRLVEEPALFIGDTALLHGHKRLPKQASSKKRIVMGHIHPKYSRKGSALSGRPVWLVLKVERSHLFGEEEKGELELYVLPAFNKELAWYGSYAKRKIISPILRRAKDGIVDAIVATLEGELIGGVESLQYVI